MIKKKKKKHHSHRYTLQGCTFIIFLSDTKNYKMHSWGGIPPGLHIPTPSRRPPEPATFQRLGLGI